MIGFNRYHFYLVFVKGESRRGEKRWRSNRKKKRRVRRKSKTRKYIFRRGKDKFTFLYQHEREGKEGGNI